MLGKMSWFCADKSGLLFYRAASDTRKDELFCADDYGKKLFLFDLQSSFSFSKRLVGSAATEYGQFVQSSV